MDTPRHPVVDSHVHFAQPRPGVPALPANRTLLVEELLAEATLAGVDQVVQVTNAWMGWDNRYSLEGATRHPGSVLGVLGRFDPFAPDLERRLAEFIAHPKMLAARFTLHQASSRDWLRERRLDPFLAAAERLGVPVALFAPHQFADLSSTVRRFPNARFLIDHMALENGPPPRPAREVFAEWRQVLMLAGEPNVWMKVSFFPEASYASERYPFAGAQLRLQQLYEAVGATRLVWGSNFPPVENVGACSWREALDFMRLQCTFLPPSDRAAILGGNFVAGFVNSRERRK